MSPALAGGLLTTAPPGKPLDSVFIVQLVIYNGEEEFGMGMCECVC